MGGRYDYNYYHSNEYHRTHSFYDSYGRRRYDKCDSSYLLPYTNNNTLSCTTRCTKLPCNYWCTKLQCDYRCSKLKCISQCNRVQYVPQCNRWKSPCKYLY